MADRIKRHQNDRGEKWTTIEEPLRPSEHLEKMKSRVVLVDCLTLWLTNHMLEQKAFSLEGEEVESKQRLEAAEKASASIKEELEKMSSQWNTTFVFVTNEIGSGTHASDAFSRTFVDYQGWINQYVAEKACRVIHMVSGCPSIIKKVEDTRGSIGGITTASDREDAWRVDKFLSSRPIKMDAKGYFMTRLEDKQIIAEFYSCIVNDKGEVCDLAGNKIPCCGSTKRREPMKVWKARTAKEITAAIFEEWEHSSEVTTVSHASYIGREVQRAEHCLYNNLPYQQD